MKTTGRAFSNLLKDEASGVFLFFLLLTPELLVDEREAESAGSARPTAA